MKKMKLQFFAMAACIAFTWLSGTTALATTVVGGTANGNGNLATALTTLGYSYTTSSDMNPNPTDYGLGAGDIIVIGSDGGTGPFVDYRPFLQAGGHVVATGGSDYQPYRDWAALYFNLTDTGLGWHQDGAWHKTASIPASADLPSNYTFGNSAVTYHMLGFIATTDTVLYGNNDEAKSIAAFRTYAGGGSFNYLALDIGKASYTTANDYSGFVLPWVKEAIGATVVPEPSTYLAGALLALPFGAQGVRYLRNRKQVA